jgi:ketosteroid isomerase-like protein
MNAGEFMPSSASAEVSSRYLRMAEDYVRAVESGATGETLAAFLHPDVTHYDLPNRFNPSGKISDGRGMLAAAERGQKVIRSQRYEILSSVAQGTVVAFEIDWLGKLAIGMAGIPAGGEMHARVAIFLEFQDDQIIMQRDYVCYDLF